MIGHYFVEVTPGLPSVCPCTACAVSLIRTLACLADASGAPAHAGNVARKKAEPVARAARTAVRQRASRRDLVRPAPNQNGRTTT